MDVIRDLINRMDAVGDRHDRRMAEMAIEQLDRLQAIEAAAKETVNTARSLAGSLTPDMPFVIREKILKLAAALGVK